MRSSPPESPRFSTQQYPFQQPPFVQSPGNPQFDTGPVRTPNGGWFRGYGSTRDNGYDYGYDFSYESSFESKSKK